MRLQRVQRFSHKGPISARARRKNQDKIVWLEELNDVVSGIH
jgi:hypothetical protein